MSATDYVDYIYLTYLHGGEFDQIAGGKWIDEQEMVRLFKQAMASALKMYGYQSTKDYDEVVDLHLNELLRLEAMAEEGDEFAGSYLKFNVSAKDKYIQNKFAGNAIAKRIGLLGAPALEKALDNVAKAEGWQLAAMASNSESDKVIPIFLSDSPEIPAADRIVSLNHNQQVQLNDIIEEVIGELDGENSVDGDSELRQRFLGELAAGKELIRAQSVRAYLLYETLAKLLGTLIDRYKGQALGEAAKKLLELLIEHVFGK